MRCLHGMPLSDAVDVLERSRAKDGHTRYGDPLSAAAAMGVRESIADACSQFDGMAYQV